MTKTINITHLLDKADHLLPNQPNICLTQLQECEMESDHHYSDEMNARYYLIEGKALGYMGDMKRASEAISKAYSFKDISKGLYAELLSWQGYFKTYIYEINEAKDLLNQSIQLYQSIGNLEGETEAKAYMGIAYLKESSFTKALKILLECIDVAKKNNFIVIEGKASSYISVVHLWLKNTIESKKWLDYSYTLSKEIGYLKMLVTNRINAANVDILRNKPNESIPKLKEALDLIDQSDQNWKSLKAIALNNLGNSYMKLEKKNPADAWDCHFEALFLGEDINSKNSICHAIFGISNVLIHQNNSIYPFTPILDHDWFKEKLQSAESIIANEQNLMLNQTIYHAHANYYKITQQFQKAFWYMEKLMEYKEKHFEKEKVESVKTIQVHYELQKKELELNELELKQKKELEKVNKSLEEKVIERTKDIKLKNKELEEYAYIVAHDLKEPIRSIVSFTQLLERKLKGKLNEDETELFGFIKNSGNDMGNLVNALLKYSTVNIKNKDLSEYDMNNILESVLQNIHYSIEESKAKINYPSLPQTIKCDKTKIIQLFQNIISNAIKFRKENEPLNINIEHEIKEEFHLFSIKDNGIGIEKEYHDKIFKLFNRLNKNERYEGTGIGLSLSKKIVEQHGGEIWIESEEGIGTTFFFTLPKN